MDVGQRVVAVLLEENIWNQRLTACESTGLDGYRQGSDLREGLVESLVLVFLHLLCWSLPDGFDVVHQFPVPDGLLNLKQSGS